MHLEGKHHTRSNPWSVLVVEGCDIYRIGIDRAILTDGRLAVVGSCKGPLEARDWLGSQEVDCIVVGLFAVTGSFESLNFIKWIKSTMPRVAVVILAEGSDHDCLRRILRIGVRAILSRTATPGVLVSAIMSGLAGHEFIEPHISRMLLGYLFVTRGESSVDAWQLTDKEAEVLDEYASGACTAMISTKLGLAQRTVNVHLTRMRAKLGARNSRELLIKAVRWQCEREIRQTHQSISGGC